MEPFPEYENYDALGLAELVRNGEVTAAELLDAAIARAEMRNPTVNAIVDKLYDHGRDTIAAGLPDGPFTGVPYLLKDIGGVLGGYVQTRGSRFFDDLVPPEDSVIVKRGKRAGLVIFGKTNTPELGLSLTCEPQLFGPSRNPWDPDAGRIIGRIIGGGRGLYRTDGERWRRFRIDSGARVVLRPGRSQADPSPEYPGSVFGRGQCGADHRACPDPFRTRLCGPPGCHGGAGFRRSLRRPSACAPVPR